MSENIFFGRGGEQRQPSTDAYLASALEAFPQSRLLAKIAELSEKDRHDLEYALNLAGDPVALFGDFEEYREEAAVAEMMRKIDAFSQATDDQKRGLAKALVESIQS